LFLFGVIGIFLLSVVGGIYAKNTQDLIDVYNDLPDNEYYVTAFLNGGRSQLYTVSSCAEAISLMDRLLHNNNSISSISIKGKYRVHLWYDDCNKTYYK